MKAKFGVWWAGAALGMALLLSGCMPTALQSQRNALVKLGVQPGGPQVKQSTVRPDAYRTPGPSALAVRTDRDAFVTVMVLPTPNAIWGETPAGALVTPEVQVKAGLTYEIPVPSFNGYRQVFTVASLQPLNLQGAQGATSVKAVADAVGAATRTLPAGGYNVATLEYQVVPFGRLTVNSNVLNAVVSVDGREVGRTPYVSGPDVPAGVRQVEISQGGFRTWAANVTVYANQDSNIFADLRPVPIQGFIVVNSEVPATFYVDGRAVGSGRSARTRVRAGPVSVSVVPLPVAGQPALNSSGTTVNVNVNETVSVWCGGKPFVCLGR